MVSSVAAVSAGAEVGPAINRSIICRICHVVCRGYSITSTLMPSCRQASSTIGTLQPEACPDAVMLVRNARGQRTILREHDALDHLAPSDLSAQPPRRTREAAPAADRLDHFRQPAACASSIARIGRISDKPLSITATRPRPARPAPPLPTSPAANAP